MGTGGWKVLWDLHMYKMASSKIVFQVEQSGLDSHVSTCIVYEG